MDEKGFILGQASATKCTLTHEALKTGKIIGASQDGSREFISVLAGICADGSDLPPTLIYRGNSHDLRNSWVEDVDRSDLAWFAATPSGWTSNSLGLQWLIGLFDRHTKEKARRFRRLLIIDGHSNHVNMAFIAAADERRIILLILPSHSTHRLQPLDVGLFSLLAKVYTKGLNDLMFHSLGLVSMNKRLFWGLFRPAWDAAFTKENIISSFEATGISPFNPNRVLTILVTQKFITPPSPTACPLTPLTPRAGRRAFRELRAAPSSAIVDRLERGHMKLTTKVSLLETRILGLEQAIVLQKRKQAKGARLNILGEKQTGDALLISPSM
jgi:DDE superfamily endonuclease